MYFFMISICDAESHFNDGTNERYHIIVHHKKLEQKTFEREKLLLLKSSQDTKKQDQIFPSLREKSAVVTVEA